MSDTSTLARAKALRFTIVHEVVSDYDDHSFLGHVDWKRQTSTFVWNVARPETGEKEFSTACPYCGKVLHVRISSLAKMASDLQFHRRRARVIGIVAAVSVALELLGYLFLEQSARGTLVLGFFGLPILAVALLLALLEVWADPHESGITTHTLDINDLSFSRVNGYYNQHWTQRTDGS